MHLKSKTCQLPFLPKNLYDEFSKHPPFTTQNFKNQAVRLKEARMADESFFQGVEHTLVPWRGYHLHVPVFYTDFRMISATFLSPLDKVKALLPSSRLHPMRPMPGKAAVSVTAYEYRESDLGPYNEVMLGIPVSLDRPLPLFTGSLRKSPQPLIVYVHTLPVTTEIARKVGVEFAGYPKYIAEIDFQEDEDWLVCRLAQEGQEILTLRGRKLDVSTVPRIRISPLTYREGLILRSEMVTSEREMGFSRRREDAQLTLGSHPLADSFKSLELGHPANYVFCPQAKAILTMVFESLSA
jgi:hypothetical protein